MTDNNNSQQDDAPQSRPSFHAIFIIILGAVIFFLGPVVGKLWALVFACGLLAFVLWQALSPGEYEEMKKTYPDMERSFWILNNLLHHLLIPVLVFAGLYGYLRFFR